MLDLTGLTSAVNNILDTQTPANSVREGLLPGEPGDAHAALTAFLGEATTAGRDIELRPGTYTLRTPNVDVDIPAGARWSLGARGAVLRMGAGVQTADWQGLLNITADGSGDVERIDVDGLALDPNRAGQDVPANAYEWEHAAALRVQGKRDARLMHVSIRDLDLSDPMADGVWSNGFYIDTLVVTGMRSRNRNGVRSDIQLSGLPRTTIISDFVGYRIETESLDPPADVEHDFHLLITNARMDKRLELGTSSDELRGRFFVHVTNVYAADSLIGSVAGTISDSELHVANKPADHRRWNSPAGLIVDNCDIYVHADANGHVDPLWITSTRSTAGHPTNLKFLGCRFHVLPAPGYTGPFTGAALRFDRSSIPGSTAVVEDCWFDERFETNVVTDRFPDLHLRRNDYSGTAVEVESLTDSRLTIDGGDFSRATSLMRLAPGRRSTLSLRNIVGRASEMAFTVSSGASLLDDLTTLSDRLILVDSAPPAWGLRGDRARLVTPVAGAPYEWVCTEPSQDRATWKVTQTLAA